MNWEGSKKAYFAKRKNILLLNRALLTICKENGREAGPSVITAIVVLKKSTC